MRQKAGASAPCEVPVFEEDDAAVAMGSDGAMPVTVRFSASHGMEGPMAIGVQLDFRGGTLEQYDQVIERVGFLPGGPSAPGELFHWVTKTDEGVRVIDVWESREAFETLREKLIPVFREVGVPAPPEIQFIEVQNYFAAGRWVR